MQTLKQERVPSLIGGVESVPVIRVGRMSEAELRDRLSYFQRRATAINGFIKVKEKDAKGEMRDVVKDLGQTVAGFFKKLLDSTTDPEAMRQRNEFFTRLEQRDPVARAQFCAARMEQFNNFLTVSLDWINFFADTVTLGDDEWAVEQNSTKNEIFCGWVAEDGTPKRVKITKDDYERRVPLRNLTTPVLRYKAKDLYRGSVVDAALQTITLAFDLANKTNYEFFRMIKTTGYQAAWAFSGAKQRWPFVANSYIDQNNLPTGNDIEIANISSSTFFDFGTLDEIIDYAARWNGLSTDGDLRPTGHVRLPSSHLKKFGSQVAVTGATNNSVADQILEKGWTGVQYRGINWMFEPRSDLPANEYICYPQFNFRPARYFRKPSQDADVVRTGEQLERLFESNEEERQIRQVYGASLNATQIWKLARFKYKS